MISKSSRYRFSVLFKSAQGDFLGNRPLVETDPMPDDQFHEVKEGDRVDLLAFRYLGRADLWWLICDYNDIFYPLDLPVGLILRMPSQSHIHLNLLG